MLKKSKKRGNIVYKLLLFVEVVITIIIAMNLSESLERYTSSISNKSQYKYESFVVVKLDENEEEAILEVQDFFERINIFDANVYITDIGIMFNGAEYISATVLLSCKEKKLFNIDNNKDTDSGLYIGNRYEYLIENNLIDVDGRIMEIAGIMHDSGFSKNEQIIIEYSKSTEELKCTIIENIKRKLEWGNEINLYIGSNNSKVDSCVMEIMELGEKYSHIDIVSGADDNHITDENRTYFSIFSDLKSIIMVVAYAFCVLSTLYVGSLYISSNRKNIAIRRAFGCSTWLIFASLIKDMMGAIVYGIITATTIEILVYGMVLKYSMSKVIVNGILAMILTIAIDMLLLVLLLIVTLRKNIAVEIGRE